MISAQTYPDLLLITGATGSGKKILVEELENTLSYLTHIIRLPSVSEAKLEVGEDLDKQFEEARLSGKKLAVAFVAPERYEDTKKYYEHVSPNANIHTALIKATGQLGEGHHKLLQVNSDLSVKELLDLNQAEIRTLESRMRQKGLPENLITDTIKNDQNTINELLKKNYVNFVIQNPGSENEKEYGLSNSFKQLDRLISLLLNKNIDKSDIPQDEYSPDNPRDWDTELKAYMKSKSYQFA